MEGRPYPVLGSRPAQHTTCLFHLINCNIDLLDVIVSGSLIADDNWMHLVHDIPNSHLTIQIHEEKGTNASTPEADATLWNPRQALRRRQSNAKAEAEIMEQDGISPSNVFLPEACSQWFCGRILILIDGTLDERHRRVDTSQSTSIREAAYASCLSFSEYRDIGEPANEAPMSDSMYDVAAILVRSMVVGGPEIKGTISAARDLRPFGKPSW